MLSLNLFPSRHSRSHFPLLGLETRYYHRKREGSWVTLKFEDFDTSDWYRSLLNAVLDTQYKADSLCKTEAIWMSRRYLVVDSMPPMGPSIPEGLQEQVQEAALVSLRR